MDYCQYFTSDSCCDALLSQVQSHSPQAVMDIGAGEGSLTRAALKRWQGVDLQLVDIDHLALEKLKHQFPSARHIRADLLSQCIPQELLQWLGHTDLALCNPPFAYADAPGTSRFWLKKANMPTNWPKPIAQRAETVFLAHNLRWLKTGGELLLILPACFINGIPFAAFREWLLQRMTVRKVARLPRNAFQKAEVNAFAIIASNAASLTPYELELIDLADDAHSHQPITISSTQAVMRMDYVFHAQRQMPAPMRLSDLMPEIARGQSVASLRSQGVCFFHTTDFVNASNIGSLRFASTSFLESDALVKAGDIVLGRVGRSCHMQVAKVLQGQSYFSDCVYRLRVPREWRQAVFKSLFSQAGQAWRGSRLRGSAVCLLSKFDLLEHPIW